MSLTTHRDNFIADVTYDTGGYSRRHLRHIGIQQTSLTTQGISQTSLPTHRDTADVTYDTGNIADVTYDTGGHRRRHLRNIADVT